MYVKRKGQEPVKVHEMDVFGHIKYRYVTFRFKTFSNRSKM